MFLKPKLNSLKENNEESFYELIDITEQTSTPLYSNLSTIYSTSCKNLAPFHILLFHLNCINLIKIIQGLLLMKNYYNL